jgi:GNAT superfamily N-acetyltransferase
MKTSDSPPIIAPLRPDQIPAAVELFCAQLVEHNLPTNAVEVRSVLDKFIADPRHGFVLTATLSDGTLIGVALACAFLGVEHGGTSGWIDELYVKPEHRGRGIGSLLIAEVIRVAKSRGWRALDLEVTDDHLRVVSLYQRHAFQPHARSRFYLKLD